MHLIMRCAHPCVSWLYHSENGRVSTSVLGGGREGGRGGEGRREGWSKREGSIMPSPIHIYTCIVVTQLTYQINVGKGLTVAYSPSCNIKHLFTRNHYILHQ